MAKRKKYNGYLRTSFTYEGKRYYIYGKTTKELLENEEKKRKELLEGMEELYNPSLNTYYEHFTEVRRREVKGSTLRSQRGQFKGIAEVVMTPGVKFGDMRMKEIKRRDIERAREILLKAGKTPQNLNNCFAHLNHVFNAAVMDETITKNPCKALKQLKRDAPEIGETKHRALSEKETELFFKTARERNSIYIHVFDLMVKSGMRVGEVGALYRTDIDRKNGFIHIRRTITRNEDGSYIVGDDVKTASGRRDIPLTDELYNIIIEQEQLNRVIFQDKKEGLLFRSPEGQLLREYTANREVNRICKAAGIEKFTCHAFRNTFATRFIEQRPHDYKALSEILGHKDISITLNLYTHVMTETKVKAMDSVRIKTG